MEPNDDDIITILIEQGYFDYGATILSVDLMAHFGVAATTDEEMAGWSIDDIRKQLSKDTLVELAVITKVRDRLIGEGKYIAKDLEAYRIFLPEENARQANNYLASAGRKQRRAARLLHYTPQVAREKSTSRSRAAIAGVRNERLAKKG